MYFLLVFGILTLSLIIHLIYEYKKKAVLTGEANLSLTEKNIMPFARVCKVCSLFTFAAMTITGIFILIGDTQSNWNLLSLSGTAWKQIHFIISLIFIILFGLHLYIHWSWIKEYFKK